MKFRTARAVAVPAILLTAGFQSCFWESNPAAPSPILGEVIVAGQSDFSEGNISLVSASDLSVRKHLKTVDQDNKVKAFEDGLYVLERTNSNLIRYDASVLKSGRKLSSTDDDYHVHLGTGLNPQDIALVSSQKAYVAYLAADYVQVVNPITGSSIRTIDISAFNTFADDPARRQPYPFAAFAEVIGDRLLVGCQRLQEDWSPGDTSCLVVISTATDEVTGSIPLQLRNPVAMSVAGTTAYLASAGKNGVIGDGGIEKVSLTTDTSLGVVVSETDVGGDITNVVAVSDTSGYLCVGVVDAAGYHVEVYRFSDGAGVIGPKIAGIGNAFGGMVFQRGTVYIGDILDSRPGIAVIDAATGMKRGETISIGLPPSSLAAMTLN